MPRPFLPRTCLQAGHHHSGSKTEHRILVHRIIIAAIIVTTLIIINMKYSLIHLTLATAAVAVPAANCPKYTDYAGQRHTPYSSGKYALPYQRPGDDCRSYGVPEVEQTIKDMQSKIKDPDLYWLFQNTWPNTVDTTVLWTGAAADNANEELAFVITGDINAMWLRDSANQLQSYKPILNGTSPKNSKFNIAKLYRGVINLQGRYIKQFPYCNAFQPPPESKLSVTPHKRSIGKRDVVNPPYDPGVVFECKYELDSLSAFLQLSWDYYEATGDAAFFGKFKWADSVHTILNTARDMMAGTYAQNGSVNTSPYTWFRQSTSATETVSNNGAGNPVNGNIGLVRSFFRPSDDSTIYQYFIPANMMFSRYLKACAQIMKTIDQKTAADMEAMAAGIVQAINENAIVNHPKFGQMYAYEVDGFGSFNLMDDANIPSLLSIPHLGYESASDSIYQNTRKFVLSKSNPYYAYGPIINAPGGPHLGPGMGWPMGIIMQIMTSDNDDEIVGGIKQLLSSTSGLGLMHESVNSQRDSSWTRPWFAWANGLFGQMLLDLSTRKPALLSRSYQN
ncbi:Meiotically up-regulated gene protein [Cladobotryum mycophilum]|uniref:Meiotically up-regulated gene protein n=1 Tax=Cladobotryum mycophilum TaxID=491253 RepID=A0ABR0SSL6_9HYPO